ncbi:hypothetical protein L838_0548 [Mycobacterium avium MAV_120709_2344]|nr:hypothetical protein L838_0548 [Mycobacterium avium MAV_120709_2344]
MVQAPQISGVRLGGLPPRPGRPGFARAQPRIPTVGATTKTLTCGRCALEPCPPPTWSRSQYRLAARLPARAVVRMAAPPMVGAVAACTRRGRRAGWAEVFFPAVPARAELRMRLGSKYRQVEGSARGGCARRKHRRSSPRRNPAWLSGGRTTVGFEAAPNGDGLRGGGGPGQSRHR